MTTVSAIQKMVRVALEEAREEALQNGTCQKTEIKLTLAIIEMQEERVAQLLRENANLISDREDDRRERIWEAAQYAGL